MRPVRRFAVLFRTAVKRKTSLYHNGDSVPCALTHTYVRTHARVVHNILARLEDCDGKFGVFLLQFFQKE